jgi:hypothetical protein
MWFQIYGFLVFTGSRREDQNIQNLMEESISGI